MFKTIIKFLEIRAHKEKYKMNFIKHINTLKRRNKTILAFM